MFLAVAFLVEVDDSIDWVEAEGYCIDLVVAFLVVDSIVAHVADSIVLEPVADSIDLVVVELVADSTDPGLVVGSIDLAFLAVDSIGLVVKVESLEAYMTGAVVGKVEFQAVDSIGLAVKVAFLGAYMTGVGVGKMEFLVVDSIGLVVKVAFLGAFLAVGSIDFVAVTLVGSID